jgi:hypothetical protein
MTPDTASRLLVVVHLNSERTAEHVRHDGSFAEKQQSHRALLFLIPSRHEIFDDGGLRSGRRSGSRRRRCADVVETRRAYGHAGSYHSAGGGLVGERDDAARRRGRADELQRERLPDEYRVSGEPDLVDQVMLEGSAESAVSVHDEVAAILFLERRHRTDDVTANDRGGVPIDALQSRGEHVLACLVP